MQPQTLCGYSSSLADTSVNIRLGNVMYVIDSKNIMSCITPLGVLLLDMGA